jgi:hypothetical protein
MVRNLTAHRVFPAKETGGNGIAGTSVAPSYSLNNTPRAAQAAMTFLLHIELYKTTGLSWFRRRYGGRPRLPGDGARGARPAVYDCASRPGSRLRLRKIRLSSIEHFSSVAPFRFPVALPGTTTLLVGRMRLSWVAFVALGRKLLWCRENGYTLLYGFGSIWPCAWYWGSCGG